MAGHASGDGTLVVLRKLPPAILTLRSDGSGLRTVLDGFEGEPDGVQVDSTSGTIFWTNMGADDTAADGAIYRADLDGGNTVLLVGHGAVVTPKQLQHDPATGHLYWCDREGMRVMGSDDAGGDVTVLVRRGAAIPRMPATNDVTAWASRSTWSTGRSTGLRRVPEMAGRVRSTVPGWTCRPGPTPATAATSKPC